MNGGAHFPTHQISAHSPLPNLRPPPPSPQSRNQRTFISISNLEAALKSFRRLLKGGYDTIPSYSAFKLLDDMDTKIGDVRVALEVGTEGLSKIAGQVSRREAAVNRDDDTMIEVLEEVERKNHEVRLHEERSDELTTPS